MKASKQVGCVAVAAGALALYSFGASVRETLARETDAANSAPALQVSDRSRLATIRSFLHDLGESEKTTIALLWGWSTFSLTSIALRAGRRERAGQHWFNGTLE